MLLAVLRMTTLISVGAACMCFLVIVSICKHHYPNMLGRWIFYFLIYLTIGAAAHLLDRWLYPEEQETKEEN